MENYTNPDENTSQSYISSPSIYNRDEQPKKSILKNGPDSPAKKRLQTSNNARVSFNLIDQVLLADPKRNTLQWEENLKKSKTSINSKSSSKKNSVEYLPEGSTPSIMNYINEKINQKEKAKNKNKNFLKKTVTENDIVSSIFNNKISDLNDEKSQQSGIKRIKSAIFQKKPTLNSSSTINSYNTQFQINIYKINQGNSEINLNPIMKVSNSSNLYKLNEEEFQEYKKKLNDSDYYKYLYERKVGLIRGYCANSFRNNQIINEDKLNIGVNLKPSQIRESDSSTSVNISFFSIFDGHGGESVSEELRVNFIDILLDDLEILTDTEGALFRTFQKMEDRIILRNNKKSKENLIDKGGSCALMVLIIGTEILINFYYYFL
jgi:hypothetical protein